MLYVGSKGVNSASLDVRGTNIFFSKWDLEHRIACFKELLLQMHKKICDKSEISGSGLLCQLTKIKLYKTENIKIKRLLLTTETAQKKKDRDWHKKPKFQKWLYGNIYFMHFEIRFYNERYTQVKNKIVLSHSNSI